MYTNARIIREPYIYTYCRKISVEKITKTFIQLSNTFFDLRWYVTNIVMCEAMRYLKVQISFFWGEQYWIQLETTNIVVYIIYSSRGHNGPVL